MGSHGICKCGHNFLEHDTDAEGGEKCLRCGCSDFEAESD